MKLWGVGMDLEGIELEVVVEGGEYDWNTLYGFLKELIRHYI